MSGHDDDVFKALSGILTAFAAYRIARRLAAARKAQLPR